MLVTLISIAVASLLTVPAVSPRARRWVGEILGKGQASEQTDLQLTEKGELGDLELISQEDLREITLDSDTQDAEPLSSSGSNASVTLTAKEKPVIAPLVEIRWQPARPLSTATVPKPVARKYQPSSDPVEQSRTTLSADRLFNETQQSNYVDVNQPRTPRVIMPIDRVDRPRAAQRPIIPKVQVSQAPSSKGSEESDLEVQTNVHEQGTRTRKARAISGEGRKSAIIPIAVTEAPAGVPQRGQFEVLSPPQANQQPRKFNLRDKPEMIASGERFWHGVQPLYIDFSPFFSLDSLIEITPEQMRRRRADRAVDRIFRFETGRGRPASRRRPKGRGVRRSSKDHVTPAEVEELLAQYRDQNEGLRDSTWKEGEELDYSEASYRPWDRESWRDEWDEDEAAEHIGDRWETNGENELLQTVPEWQFLLGSSSQLLFNLKLEQSRTPNHQRLTEQGLEEALAFQITNDITGTE